MSKKIIALFVLLITLYAAPIFAEDLPPEPTPETPPEQSEPLPEEPATETIHLKISTNTSTIYDSDLSVEACNSDNGATETIIISAYCAVLASGIDNEWNWDWAPGAFLDSLNGIAGFTSQDADGNDVYHFWSWYLNDSEATTALNQYELETGDNISIKFIEPEEPAPNEEEDNNSGSSGGGGGSSRSNKSSGSVLGEEVKAVFSIPKALNFIWSNQKEDGAFGSPMYTDWATIGIAAAANDTKLAPITNLIKYFSTTKFEAENLTEYERRAMALMSLGLNPYSTNGVNYIEKIVQSFDGRQFGDLNEYNDDVFAILVLGNAGYDIKDPMLVASAKFIIETQSPNGSWTGSPDMTGAVLQALAPFAENEEFQNSIELAKKFLKESQQKNATWGDDVSSTAWVLGGVLALGQEAKDWDTRYDMPLDIFATAQDPDGGIKNDLLENRIWQTAYAIPAASGKSWAEIMQKFEKVEIKAEQKLAGKPKVSSASKPKKAVPTSVDTAPLNVNPAPTATPPTPPTPPLTPKPSWFSLFLGNIFNF